MKYCTHGRAQQRRDMPSNTHDSLLDRHHRKYINEHCRQYLHTCQIGYPPGPPEGCCAAPPAARVTISDGLHCFFSVLQRVGRPSRPSGGFTTRASEEVSPLQRDRLLGPPEGEELSDPQRVGTGVYPLTVTVVPSRIYWPCPQMLLFLNRYLRSTNDTKGSQSSYIPDTPKVIYLQIKKELHPKEIGH